MRSPIFTASSMSCVTNTTVLRSSACRRRNSSCSRVRVIGIDRAERLVHQQHRRIGRERTGDADALALTARELRRDSGRGTSPGSRPTVVSSSSTRAVDARAVPTEQPRHGRDVASRSSGAGTGRPAGSRSRCGGAARRDRRVVTSSSSTRMRPPVGSMSRLIMRRIVVLPQPDGPTRTAISPSATSRLRSLDRERVRSRYRLLTESRRITPGPFRRKAATVACRHAGVGAAPSLGANGSGSWIWWHWVATHPGEIRTRPERAHRAHARSRSGSGS